MLIPISPEPRSCLLFQLQANNLSGVWKYISGVCDSAQKQDFQEQPVRGNSAPCFSFFIFYLFIFSNLVLYFFIYVRFKIIKERISLILYSNTKSLLLPFITIIIRINRFKKYFQIQVLKKKHISSKSQLENVSLL